MQTPSSTPNVQPLTDRPVPELNEEQLAVFTQESIYSAEVMPFSADTAAEKLHVAEGSRLLAADFGGDKGIVRVLTIDNGTLVVTEGYADDIQSNGGEGYLDTLKRAAIYAESEGIPFGISWGTPLDGTKPFYHPKAETFLRELGEQFDGDMQAISSSITSIINDGPAGALSGAVAAYRQHGSSNVIFVINGGGINTSAVIGGTLYAHESGHVEGLAALNTYSQSTPCGVFDAQYVCVERLSANKAGIEAQWQDKTGSYMRAIDIENEYKAGNAFAGELYDHSAWVVGHLVVGVARAYNLNLADSQTAVVAHGGAFKFPHYGERIGQIIAQHDGGVPHVILAKDYVPADSNACLEGAAIAALYNA